MKHSMRMGVVLAGTALVVGGLASNGAFASGPAQPKDAGRASHATVGAVVASRVFAVVNSNGTLARGRGVTSVTRFGTGQYAIRFSRNIGACAWEGTIGLGVFGSSAAPGFITVQGLIGTNNGLFVTTHRTTGAAGDAPFHALVVCA
jgi:hypothetical protein